MSLNESYPLMRHFQRELEGFHQALSVQQRSLKEGYVLLDALWRDADHQAIAVMLETVMAENDAYLKTDAPVFEDHIARKLQQLARYLRGNG
ncbi:hypothetical protein J8I88_03855 [Duffyella gerundensis]|uniref:hypothetical protein n=1 Tax=Duffyella gerundensis TaxID=1619313 RepID=UPI00169F7EB4|nr:hypothetical protein [Duffyella gerundensis]QTO55015.1 hypothetical protein J8I88_03855 [Duffyella gerundensis]